MRLFVCLLALSFVVGVSKTSEAQMDVFLDFDADWVTNLNSMATTAGVSTFSGLEFATIEAAVESELNSVYSDYLISFSTSTPGGSFTRIDFGATGSSALGSAPLDYFNLTVSQTANMYASNFGFILNEFSGMTDRSTQIAQISMAIAGTAAHELGHSVGMHHFQAYGVPGIFPGNYGATGGLQNTHVIATGSTGLGELGRETSRTVGQWSELVLESAGGLDAGLHGVTGTALAATVLSESDHFSFGDVGGSAVTADLLADMAMPISGYDYAVNAYSEIGTGADEDFFALEMDGAGVISAEVISTSRWASSFDTVLDIYDTDGLSILASNDDARYSGNVYGSGGSGTTDSFLINVPVASAGTYYLRVSSFGGDTGVYNLLVGAKLTSIPEPASMTLLGLIGVGLFVRRRKQSK